MLRIPNYGENSSNSHDNAVNYDFYNYFVCKLIIKLMCS